jgi:exonuclease SbcD
LEVEKVLVANHRSTWKVETKGGVLQLLALPWTQRSALLSRDEYKNLSLEQLNHRMQEDLREWLVAQVSSLDPTLPTLLAAHVSIATANPGSEKSMMIGREHILTQSDIALPPFDYVALGHIHKRQSLGQNPPVVYPGSLSAIDFSDEGEEKGFYVIELERTRASGERVLSYSFHPVKTRRFLTIEVEDDTENPTAAVLHALAKRDTKDAIVRLQIKLSASQQGLLRESEVQRALKDAHFVTITKEVQHQPRIRLGNCPAEGLTPMAALKSYLESKRTTPQRTEVLLEYGERLIQEQD